MKYKVIVPASSANLGCGFDTLAIALNIYNTYIFSISNQQYEFINCNSQFNNKDNLVYISFLKTLKYLNKKIKGIKIEFDCKIPLSGGLGSSSCCIIAGIYGAYLITNTKINTKDILNLALTIENHSDNLTASIYGGLIATCNINNKLVHTNYNIDHRFSFLIIYPNYTISTKKSRQLLPNTIPFKDAIENISRLSIILKAFETYQKDLLTITMGDKLHEPYRKELIHEYHQVKNICHKIDSIYFYISGSGATLVNIINDTSNIDKINKELSKLNYKWQTILLNVDNKGTRYYNVK